MLATTMVAAVVVGACLPMIFDPSCVSAYFFLDHRLLHHH
jgi:hypothetical protein